MVEIDLDLIEPNNFQPRTNFDEERLEQLAQSIRANGIIQPLLVRRISADKYQLVAGERRWRAAQRAGLHRVPCVIKEIPEDKMLELALIENIQRQELNAIEEAQAIKDSLKLWGSRKRWSRKGSAEIGPLLPTIYGSYACLKISRGWLRLSSFPWATRGHFWEWMSPRFKGSSQRRLVRKVYLCVRQSEQ
jgi:hypothetical protein